jgi:uncharacterized protein (TIGR00369 family)
MPSRTYEWLDPMATAAGARGRTGLAFLRAILDGTLPPAPMSCTLDFALVAADEGSATFRGVPGLHHYNPMGGVHGGLAATLLDSAMGSAVMSTLDASEMYATVDLHVQMVRPITAASGPLTAIGTIVHRGKRIATAEGRLRDDRGAVVAHGTTTCAIAPRP